MNQNFTGYVISHTHWDREWYLPFQDFRMRLVNLLDTLIPYLESHPEVMETLDQKVRAHYALSGSEEAAESGQPDAGKKTGASSDLKLDPASKVADEAEKKE